MRKSFLKIVILIILFILIITNISIAIPGKLNDSNVRVRSGPSTEGTKTLTNLYLNDSVDVIEKNGDWYKIKTENGIIGYIFAKYVDVKGKVPIVGETNSVEEKKKTTEEKPKEVKEEVVEKKENKEKEKEIKKELLTVKLTKEVNGKYMPLMYSTDKIIYKKDEVLKILDEKGKWLKVLNDNQESWILKIKIQSENMN